MADHSLGNFIKRRLRAISFCFEQELFADGLVLLYAAIDALGWLNMPQEKSWASETSFVDWVDKFLLPDSNLPCTAGDLYAARCGLLHTSTAESRLSREGKTREVNYLLGDSGRALISIMTNTPQPFVLVEIGILLAAFEHATQRFEKELLKDPVLAERVENRVEHHFLEAEFLA